MNILFDTNIILDVILTRRPYYNTSMRVLVLSEKKKINGFISSSAITDIFYIISKHFKNKKTAKDILKKLIKTVQIASITEDSIYSALDLDWDDFEDAIQFISGKSIAASYILTRNKLDYTNSTIPVLSPEEFLNQIDSIAF